MGGYWSSDSVSSEYTRVKELGSGAFGTVYEATRKCALKEIDISGIPNDERTAKKAMWKKEVEALKKAHGHENIVEYRNSFATVDNKLWLEMEYCNGGTLNDYVIEKKPGRVVKHRLMVEISSGVAFLHSNGIVHRDLKPENIMMSMDEEDQPHAKVGDFGLAKMLADTNFGGNLQQYYLQSECGTEYFMAPEVYDGHYTEKADIFSLGIIFYAMVPVLAYQMIGSKQYLMMWLRNYKGRNGDEPFGRYMHEVSKGLFFIETYEGRMSTNALQLFDSMIKKDPKDRPSAENITTKLRHITPKELSSLAPAPAASP